MLLNLNVPKFITLQKQLNLNDTKTAQLMHISRYQLWRVKKGQCVPGEQFIAGFKNAFPNEIFEHFFLLPVMHENDTQQKVI